MQSPGRRGGRPSGAAGAHPSYLVNMKIIPLVYRRLYRFHGPQGWWPIVNPRTLGSEYHLNAPRHSSDFFEIVIGAILTQNIAWKNVDRAIYELKRHEALDPLSLRKMRIGKLGMLIRPTGYYNQKAKKIKNFLAWYGSYDYDCRTLRHADTETLRGELLSINGIGPETADSILLYALNKRIFVVDAYTHRIFSRIGLLKGKSGYHDVQELFHGQFRGSVDEYKDYHALIVAHGKDFCRKKPRCEACCLSDICEKRI
jgi:endonuclease III related protein